MNFIHRRPMRFQLACLAGCAVATLTSSTGAMGGGLSSPSMLSPDGRADYRAFLDAPDHRAFAIAPGGAWGWASGMKTPEAAKVQAAATCQQLTSYRCVVHTVDSGVVFDERQWAGAWQPVRPDTASHAGNGRVGAERTGARVGERFPDLAFVNAEGRRSHVGALRGKTVVVHLWGAWCPPCRQEMPELAELHATMQSDPRVAFVILQVREPIAVSRRWAAERGVRLPLADSGTDADESRLRRGDDKRIEDRELADVFPSTWVLDARGRVVFAQRGPLHGWPAYVSLLRDVASRSGK